MTDPYIGTEVASGLGELRDRVGNLEAGLAENTRMTKAIRDEMETNSADTSELLQMFRDARGGFRVLGLMGQILKWMLAIGASAVALWLSLKGK
jgi:hypothetical protein